jgi:hypothetical protein
MTRLASKLSLFLLAVLPLPAFAQGIQNADKIISAKIIPWCAAAGAAWCGVGMVSGFMKLSNGDDQGKAQIVKSAIGAAGCAGVAGLLALVISWAK